MKKLINKIIAGTMAAAIALSTGVTAFAADTQQITPGNTGSTTVKANVESEAVVWLPTNITISGTPDENNQYTGEGAVIVEGDIAGNEFISVTPESSISLEQPGKDDIVAQVTQEKTTFTYDDLQNSNSAVTSISADTLSAGEWSSVLHYNVSLDENPLPPGYTTLYEYDLSATAADDVKAYYMVPNKNTSPIEVEKQANKIKSRTAATSDQTEADNIIEYNGIRYVLSDEDTFVISGEGDMKPDIQKELIDYEGIKNLVLETFPNVGICSNGYAQLDSITGNPIYADGRVVFDVFTKDKDKEYFIEWEENSIFPNKQMFVKNSIDSDSEISVCGFGVTYDEETSDEKYFKYDPYCAEIMQFIEDNYTDYVVSMPKHVIIQEGITSVSEKAFYKCNSLQTVELSDSVVSIGDYAFSNCPNLEAFDLKNVKALGRYAFSSSTFESIDISNIEDIGNGAFAESSLTKIVLPNGITSTGANTFTNCTALKEIVIPDSVTSIGSYAFKGCNSLQSIQIPDNISYIGDSAFNSCENLQSVYIPDSVTYIGRAAFSWIKDDATIYCETQRVANMLSSGTHYMPGSIDVVVDASMFL